MREVGHFQQMKERCDIFFIILVRILVLRISEPFVIHTNLSFLISVPALHRRQCKK